MMRILGIFILTLLIFGCKKSSMPEEPKVVPPVAVPLPPTAATLAYPNNNSECTTGISINDTTSQVEFRWTAGENTDLYTLNITNLNSGFTQSVNTAALKLSINLEKGTPYTWSVISKNDDTTSTSTSSKWAFYNSGFVTQFVPFPAEIIFPKIGDNTFLDLNDEVTLEWSGADLDKDIESYDIYFSTLSPPETLLSTQPAEITEQKVAAESGIVYYWKVITKDLEGNTSDSGVFSFKAF